MELANFTEIVIGRLIAVDIKIQDISITLINIYGSNKDDPHVFSKLNSFLLSNADKIFIIGGDFNTVLTGLDKKNGNFNTHKSCRKSLIDLMATNELSDIWRIKHPDKNQFTWHSNCKLHIFCRLDFFLISNNLCNLISKCNIKPGYKTDHSLVQLNIDNLLLGKGRGYFKINNSILLDVDYQNKIKQSINDITNLNKECNPNTMWELIKSTIRNETIKYCSIKNKKSKKEEEELIKEITTLQQNLINCNSTDSIENITNIIKAKQQELEHIYDKKVNGYILRSNAIQVE